jgi:hypothetical protein
MCEKVQDLFLVVLDISRRAGLSLAGNPYCKVIST